VRYFEVPANLPLDRRAEVHQSPARHVRGALPALSIRIQDSSGVGPCRSDRRGVRHDAFMPGIRRLRLGDLQRPNVSKRSLAAGTLVRPTWPRRRRHSALVRSRRSSSRSTKSSPDLFGIFYERAIDFGGHPNPHATFSTMSMPDPNPDNSLTMYAMVTDKTNLRHAMKSVAQVGLTALFIFRHIWKPKFELLGTPRRNEPTQAKEPLSRGIVD
jgi:hypothetical protein